MSIPAARNARVMRGRCPSEDGRAQGMPGEGLTHARLQQKTQAAVTTGSAGSTGIPRAMVLTAYTGSPWCAGLVGHHHPAQRPAELDSSVGESGPHDFAVRVRHVRLTRHQRPSHPRPTYRDDRPKRPSSSRLDAREGRSDLPDGASEKICDRLARRADEVTVRP